MFNNLIKKTLILEEKQTKKAIVIGAGVAGLASSIRLAKLGMEVIVFETNEFVGGKLNSQRIGKYRFDMGPSIFTGIEYLKELFDICGEDFTSFKYNNVKNSFCFFYPDGQHFSFEDEDKSITDILSKNLNEKPEVIKKYLEKTNKNYQLIRPLFIESPLNLTSNLFSKKFWKALFNLSNYKLNQTMNEENENAFSNPKTIQFFNRYATYNGSNPYQSPAMLNMISHLELNVGAFLPENGMIQITEALYNLALKQGVKFELNRKVDEIVVHDKKVKGVKVKDKFYESDFVFSNMDISFTYEKLLKKEIPPRKILQQEKSSSTIVFYWGIKSQFHQLNLHNIFFSEDYKNEFDHIFLSKTLPNDPTIYVNITSKKVPNDAPKGCENWFVMINTPINNGQNWEEYVLEARKKTINKLNKLLSVDLEKLIENEKVMDPIYIEKTYSGKQGSIYGNSSNNTFAAFYRHSNLSKKIKNLFFVGVTVHPGGGIPLALNSAKIAVDLIKK
jgi:phytoene desaturase